jgi:Na+/proline symporter
MFDISGTMWMVTLTVVYGIKSIWIPWLWPVFNQIFLMMYLATWLRRSNATTGAEWMLTRFGNGKGAKLAHSIIVVFAVASCFGFLAYGFVGLGKFIELFIPWSTVQPYVPFTVSAAYVPHIYGVMFTLFAVFYTVLGGMTSIVAADVMQYLIMATAAVFIAWLAMDHLGMQSLAVPEGWFNPFFGWQLDLDWSQIMPAANEKIASDGFGLFTIFFMMMLFKGILASVAGPAPNYDMQKLLSTRSPRDAAKMSGVVSVILLPVRYLMITGFAVLGLLYFRELNLQSASGVDFERIMPAVIAEYVPHGWMGVVLAGLLAAFIGTFAGTLNAAQAYLINDVYLKYVRPQATAGQIKATTYTVGILVVLLSIIFGMYTENVNTILQWIVSALYGSYVAANVLKWHWWRFNGHGFFWGMLAGMVPALVLPYVWPGMLELYYFPLILVISIAGCLLGTYSAPPVEMPLLVKFYTTVRPWGWWKPVYEEALKLQPTFTANPHFRRDMFNVVIGIIAQLCLTLLPIYLVLRMKLPLLFTLLLFAGCVFILKKTWWNSLHKESDF